jgi:cytochrome c2
MIAGDKTSDLLAWGDAAIACDRPLLECYTVAKIATPRRFAGLGLTPVMPNLDLSEDDAVALAIFALGHRQTTIPPRYRRHRSDDQRVDQDGERLLARKSCRGCHEIGRTEQRIVDDDGDLIEIDYTPIGARTIDLYETPADAPPPLTFAGEKFQYPWLFEFLAAPSRLRPWLLARMPTYTLDDDERTLLVSYFAGRNQQPFPFERIDRPRLADADRAAATDLFALLQCSKCHQVSTQAELRSGELAPDLALARERLKTGWQRRWILDPQTLQPGTGMPTYFALADEDDPESHATPCPKCLGGDIGAQIDALVRLTIDFSAP